MTAVPKALSIDGAFALANLFSIALSAFAKEKKANPWVLRSHYQKWDGTSPKVSCQNGIGNAEAFDSGGDEPDTC
jgi:hypothetical protein